MLDAPRTHKQVIITKPRAPLVRNIVIEQLRPDQLHAQWGWLKRGCLDILDKIRPHSDWLPEDLYAALAYPQHSSTACFIVSRNSKALGWIAGELQRDRYGRLEWFLWTAWDIPPAEREPGDDVEGARDQLIEYVRIWAKGQGCSRVTTLSARKLEYLGWTKGHTVYYLPL